MAVNAAANLLMIMIAILGLLIIAGEAYYRIASRNNR